MTGGSGSVIGASLGAHDPGHGALGIQYAGLGHRLAVPVLRADPVLAVMLNTLGPPAGGEGER